MVRKKKSSSKSASPFGPDYDSDAFAVAMEKIVAETHAKNAGFGNGKEMENRIAEIVWGKFREAHISEGNSAESSQVSSAETSQHHSPPEDIATIVISDVEDATSVWEEKPHAMQEAVSLHDKILRRNCDNYNGYEIDTEGDRFFLAFHTPLDAFSFALKTQLDLYEADWSSDILETSAAAAEKSFRGLRVRMSIHQGAVTSYRNGFTGRLEYDGEAITLAKRIGAMSRGGQILTSSTTWNEASYKAESSLNSPQVLDLGNHIFTFKGGGDPKQCRILQLVPASLAYDYFAARRRPADRLVDADGLSPPPITGRQFEPIDTDEKDTASFHDAPYENLEVTIAFVRFSEIENQYEDPKPIISDLIRLLCDLLVGTRGYHCQNNMLAFPNINEAIEFGLNLMQTLKENYYSELPGMITFGCVHDCFLTMGPHKTTGRADYYGKVVNRAAHVSANSALGTVNFGMLVDDSNPKLPLLKDEFECHFRGVKELKGVQGEMAIYEVTLKDKEEEVDD